ncbi:single-stranded-DNA-specific exonuclease RecJ [Selenomonas sputigena]|uniref:single-stranded-DNA-specific exonuclease RecJ n=1 Tax=Selenomonas sputigena TaxID=69823 RepID=UPI0028E25178|nr:single-stranded-DNA-specific exonuclease RecJ [Selenomonas sputigena]
MEKEWSLLPDTSARAVEFSQRIGTTPFTAALLLHRGITSDEEARAFLHPEKQPFHDPFLMRDMEKAVSRIEQAIEAQERIVVYGDYDVDGITATSLLCRNLRQLGAAADYFIPHRQKDGYGLHKETLDEIIAGGARLIVTVDCGISAVEEAAAAKDKVDLIITDHHLPGKELPKAFAVIDPHRADCAYPDKNIAGVGVAFKLCQALWQKMRGKAFTGDLDIVALGTVADVVPLLGENRKIVQQGLRVLKKSKRPGIQALLAVTELQEKEITAGHIGFVLAPRLNAAGRLASALRGVELLLTEDGEEAQAIAEELDAANRERQAVEQEILQAAEKQIEEIDVKRAHVLVLHGEGWHPGVIGIVASRIVERYYRPTVIIAEEDGIGKGSCRSIRGFHMFEALSACGEHLLGFGGHAQAAGLSLRSADVASFREAMEAYAAKVLTEEDFVPILDIELELAPEKITEQLMTEIKLLEPYGMGNPKPLFSTHGVRGSYARQIGKEGQHLKFELDGLDASIDVLAWGKGEEAPLVNRERIDIAYFPEYHVWREKRSLQLMLEDFRPARAEAKHPDRDVLASVYRFLLARQRAGEGLPADAEKLLAGYLLHFPAMGIFTFQKALQIFEELGVLLPDDGRYAFCPPQGKLDLQKSRIFREGNPL